MTKNLWGIIPTVTKEPLAYVQIMREQAKLLEEQTQKALTGWITEYSYSGIYTCEFSILAPSLDRYRYTILRTFQGFFPFPVFVYDRNRASEDAWEAPEIEIDMTPDGFQPYLQLNTAAADELSISPNGKRIHLAAPTYKIHNDKEFEDALAEILQSKETREIITSLLLKVNTQAINETRKLRKARK